MVMSSIGLSIVSGQYPPGSLLPTKETLSRQFQVSNSTLREALQKLSTKGMIHAKTRVGTRVLPERHWNMFDADILAWRCAAGVDRTFLAHLFTLRQAFEPMAAAIMAQQHDVASIHKLALLAQKMMAADQDRDAVANADLAFHLLILECAGNPFLHSIAALIRTALLTSFTMTAPGLEGGAEGQVPHDHSLLVRAIASGNAQGAAEAMQKVIQAGWSVQGGGDLPTLATLDLAWFAP